MKTITIHENSAGIPVVDAADGKDIGSSSTSLFLRDSMTFTYLVVNTQGEDGSPTQMLAHRENIVSWNGYAITVEMPDDILQGDDAQVSPGEYVDLIGLQTQFENGTVVGKVRSASVSLDSGELLSFTVQHGDELRIFIPQQIMSLDDRNVITIRKSSQPHFASEEKTDEEENLPSQQQMFAADTAEIKQMLKGIMTLLEALQEKNVASKADEPLSQQKADEAFAPDNTVPFADISIPSLETVTADDVKIDDQEQTAEPVQALPLTDIVTESVDQEEVLANADFLNGHMEEIAQQATQMETLWEDMAIQQESDGSITSEPERMELSMQASLLQDASATEDIPTTSEQENVLTEVVPDVVEKLELKSQRANDSEEGLEENTRIHLLDPNGSILNGQESVGASEAPQEASSPFMAQESAASQEPSASFATQEGEASQEASSPFATQENTAHQEASSSFAAPQEGVYQSAPTQTALVQTARPLPPQVSSHTSINPKVYLENSGSQVLGMALFTGATVAFSLLQLL